MSLDSSSAADHAADCLVQLDLVTIIMSCKASIRAEPIVLCVCNKAFALASPWSPPAVNDFQLQQSRGAEIIKRHVSHALHNAPGLQQLRPDCA